jgi:hypothetical protein
MGDVRQALRDASHDHADCGRVPTTADDDQVRSLLVRHPDQRRRRSSQHDRRHLRRDVETRAGELLGLPTDVGLDLLLVGDDRTPTLAHDLLLDVEQDQPRTLTPRQPDREREGAFRSV